MNRWVDRHFFLVICAIGAGLAATLIKRALATPFWHDEIFTILASGLPPTTLWAASRDGLDLAPPFNTALTHVVHRIAGVGLVATRIPPLLGFLVAFVAIGVAVRQLSNALIGISAALLLSHTAVYVYAVEARGYGVVTGCFAVAFVAWLTYASGRGGRFALAALTLALAAGLWTHYYFVFAVLPIVAGEVVRQYSQRRIDRAFWVAMAVAVLLALPLGMLLSGTLVHAKTFWGRMQPVDLRATYDVLLSTLVGSRFRAMGAGLVVLLVVAWFRRRRVPSGRRLPGHVVTAGLACLVIPAVALLFARTIGHDVFAPRYVMFATAGFAFVIALGVWRLAPAGGVIDVVVCSVLMIFFVRTVWRTFEPGRLVYADPMARHALLTSRIDGAGGRTIVTGGTRFLEMWYYAPPDRRDRVIYLADPDAELDVTGTDAIDRGFLALARWTDVGVHDAATFVASERDVAVYDIGDFWQRPGVEARGMSLEEVGRDEKGVMYRVRW
jgi:hypothetical protein